MSISVVIPVGPDPAYLEWLPECIDSVMTQTRLPGEIFIVNDGAWEFNNVAAIYNLFKPYGDSFKFKDRMGKTCAWCYVWEDGTPEVWVNVLTTPFNCGYADAFNFGVAGSMYELVFMLGSDDVLYPTCLEEIWKEYEKQNKRDGWYAVSYDVEDTGPHGIPNNNAAVTKNLFLNILGGFPHSAAIGGGDAILLSILMKHVPGSIIYVKNGKALARLRDHPHQVTKHETWLFSDEVLSIRNKETARWTPKNIP